MNRVLSLIIVLGVSTSLVLAQSAGPAKPGTKPQAGKPPVASKPSGPRFGGGGMFMGGRMKEMETRVLNKLNLTVQQKSSIKTLNEKTEKSLKALRPTQPKPGQKPERPTQAQMDKMRSISKGRHDGLMKILTKQQQANYKTLMDKEMKAWRAEREKRRGSNGAPPVKASKP